MVVELELNRLDEDDNESTLRSDERELKLDAELDKDEEEVRDSESDGEDDSELEEEVDDVLFVVELVEAVPVSLVVPSRTNRTYTARKHITLTRQRRVSSQGARRTT